MSRKSERVERAIRLEVAAAAFVTSSVFTTSSRDEEEFERVVLETAEAIKQDREEATV